MHRLIVKTKYVEKLKALGAYDAWVCNVKRSVGARPNDNRLNRIATANTFYSLMVSSFLWSGTPEGASYWAGISQS
jgi:hypothetical protein